MARDGNGSHYPALRQRWIQSARNNGQSPFRVRSVPDALHPLLFFSGARLSSLNTMDCVPFQRFLSRRSVYNFPPEPNPQALLRLLVAPGMMLEALLRLLVAPGMMLEALLRLLVAPGMQGLAILPHPGHHHPAPDQGIYASTHRSGRLNGLWTRRHIDLAFIRRSQLRTGGPGKYNRPAHLTSVKINGPCRDLL